MSSSCCPFPSVVVHAGISRVISRRASRMGVTRSRGGGTRTFSHLGSRAPTLAHSDSRILSLSLSFSFFTSLRPFFSRWKKILDRNKPIPLLSFSLLWIFIPFYPISSPLLSSLSLLLFLSKIFPFPIYSSLFLSPFIPSPISHYFLPPYPHASVFPPFPCFPISCLVVAAACFKR